MDMNFALLMKLCMTSVLLTTTHLDTSLLPGIDISTLMVVL